MMTQISDHTYYFVHSSLRRDKASMRHRQEPAAFWDSRRLDTWQSWDLAARGTGRLGTQPWLCCPVGVRLNMSLSLKGSSCPSQQD